MLDRFLPRGVKREETSKVFDAILILVFGVLGLLTALFYASFYFFVHHSTVGALILLTGGLSLVTATVLHWRWPSPMRSGVIQCLVVLLFTATMSILRGGFVPAVLVFLIPVPLLAVYMVGRGTALALTATTVVVDVGLFMASRAGVFEGWTVVTADAARQEMLGLAGLVGASVLVSLIALTHAESRRAADREREEAERRAMEEQRLKSLGQLAGSVAHDFNNLLMAILGTTELVLEEHDSDAPLRADMEVIREASMRAKHLTHKLLLFSRKDRATKKVIAVNDVIEASLPLLRRSLREDIELELSLGEAVPPVEIDPRQLEHALLNLTLNARDAMPRGGLLSVETAGEVQSAETDPDGKKARGWARITISDTGIGIEPELAARVFEPFFTTKGAGRGTGLGLASIHGIVTATGGRIDVESTPGEGTSFRILLPEADTAALTREAPTPMEPSVEKAGGTVLLAEDDADVRRIARRMLEHQGYRVLDAEDGDSALALLATNEGSVDLLLSDVVMPRMSGPALAVAAQRRQPDLAVLFMSGYPAGYAQESSLPESEDVVLSKPFTEKELLRHVEAALAARRSRGGGGNG